MHFDHINKYRTTFRLTLVTAALGLAACISNAAGPAQSQLPTLQIRVGEHDVKAELANTALSRQIGLMNRKELGMNSGMLFVFKRSETQCMWMKNTLIDLDVAFADASGKILNIEQMKAGTADIHCSSGNAKLALEMNRDWFSTRGIDAGEILQVPEQVLETKE
jgi:uncharacterized protein